jgi:hypothetical protein
MLILLIIISLVTFFLLTVCENSWMGREYQVYRLVNTYPFLRKEFIRSTYDTFLENGGSVSKKKTIARINPAATNESASPGDQPVSTVDGTGHS